MNGVFRFISILLLPACGLFCGESSKKPFDHAEELFVATLYQESIPYYLQVSEPDLQPMTLYRLGQVHFYSGAYAEALDYLKKVPLEQLTPPKREETLLLRGICLRHFGLYDQVIAFFSRQPFTIYHDEAAYELGLAYFLQGKSGEAAQCFRRLDHAVNKPDLYMLSRFYLARLALAEGCPAKAFEIINGLAEPGQGELRQELAFLNGIIAYQQHDFQKALEYLTKALPQNSSARVDWESEVLYSMGWSYIKLAYNEKSPSKQNDYIQKAEESFSKLAVKESDERFLIALAHTFLMKADLSKDITAYSEADTLLREFDAYTSEAAAVQAVLMRAEAAGSYAAREAFYDQLTDESCAESPYYAKAWYFKALNDFEEARAQKSADLYLKAAGAFEKAQGLLESQEDRSFCCKYHVYACWEQGSVESKLQALRILQNALDSNMDDEDEFDRLYEGYANQLIHESLPEGVLKNIDIFLKKRAFICKSPSTMMALASFLFKRGMYEEAQKAYFDFTEKFPTSPQVPQALLQASLALELSQGDPVQILSLRKKIYEKFPISDAAPQAYFLCYTYQDYLQGNRLAIKHLEAFKELFPDSPLLINVNYLLGLDLKRDRRSPEGKWLRKKAPAQSVQAFLNAERAFDRLLVEGKLPGEDLEYYVRLRYRAPLERALVHYGVAEESNAAKRDIYLQYAIDTLNGLRQDLEDDDHSLASAIAQENGFSNLHEECLYWLALSHLKARQTDKGVEVIESMLEKYRQASMTGGYYLSRIYYELGMISLGKQAHAEALAYFVKADEASKGRYLGVDEKLDLWLRQSECFKMLEQPESAMLVLSKVINDDSASHFRLKAMFMRAALYETLGRPELARRQLESVAKMGGEWAEQAKIKLDQDYANH